MVSFEVRCVGVFDERLQRPIGFDGHTAIQYRVRLAFCQSSDRGLSRRRGVKTGRSYALLPVSDARSRLPSLLKCMHSAVATHYRIHQQTKLVNE